jgi:hypothetical protein
MSEGIFGQDGFPENGNVSDKTFYGFKLSGETGNLDLQIIDDDSVAIKLPDLQDDIVDKDDYKHWVWSQNSLQFQWTDDGHLQVKIV